MIKWLSVIICVSILVLLFAAWKLERHEDKPVVISSPAMSGATQILRYQNQALGISLAYPSNWGQIIVSGSESSFCSNSIEFSSKPTVTICESSLAASKTCADNPPCTEIIDPQIWLSDRREIQTLKVGDKCSHLSLAGCFIIGSQDGSNVMIYYDYRPERKVYVQYGSKYRIETVLDLDDEFASKYQADTPPLGVVGWLMQGQVPSEAQMDVNAFDSVAKSIQGD